MNDRTCTWAGYVARRLLVSLAIVIVPVVAADPAHAELAVPEGCRPVATALKSACHATTLMECHESRQAHTYQNGELRVVHEYTPKWEMTGFRFAGFAAVNMTSVPGTVANTQLDTLFETGRSEEAGDFLFDTGAIKNRPYVLSGHIELTGETVRLGGVEFQRATMYRLFETKRGAGGMEFELDIYVSSDRDLLIEADWTRSVFGSDKESFSQTPYHLAWPGEDGFAAMRSEQGCD